MSKCRNVRDDAMVGIGQSGRVALKFTREAESAKLAIVGALEDVKISISAAKPIEAGPDFVGLTHVADMSERFRQHMRKLMHGTCCARMLQAIPLLSMRAMSLFGTSSTCSCGSEASLTARHGAAYSSPATTCLQ